MAPGWRLNEHQMEEEKMNVEKNSAKKARTHTVYKNSEGKRVPGVTTITGVLNKPALVPWANKIGLQGIEVSKYVDDLAAIGTLAHYMVECHIKKEKPALDDYSKNQIDSAETSFLKFLDWEGKHKIQYMETEKQLISEKFQYGGTLDILMVLDGVRTLVDLKTCKAIYSDHFLQVGGGYMLLANENIGDIKEAGILRIGRSEEEGIEAEYKPVPNILKFQKMFLLCLDVYNLKKEIKL